MERDRGGGGGGAVEGRGKPGEIGESYAKFHSILQSKKRKEAGAIKNRTGSGIKGYGNRD